MLNKNVIGTLKALNSITNSGIIRYPTTILNNPSGDVVVKLGLDKLDTDSFDDIGIYNLSEFISTFSLFDDYECSINDNIISIKSKDSSVQYLTTNIAVLGNHDKSDSIFTSTAKFPSVCSAEITISDMKKIKSASSIFKELTEIIFISKDGDLSISLGNTNNFNAKSNSFSIAKNNVNCTKEFSIKVPSENFNSLPLSNYMLEVKYNESRDVFRIMLNSLDSDVSVLLAVKK